MYTEDRVDKKMFSPKKRPSITIQEPLFKGKRHSAVTSPVNTKLFSHEVTPASSKLEQKKHSVVPVTDRSLISHGSSKKQVAHNNSTTKTMDSSQRLMIGLIHQPSIATMKILESNAESDHVPSALDAIISSVSRQKPKKDRNYIKNYFSTSSRNDRGRLERAYSHVKRGKSKINRDKSLEFVPAPKLDEVSEADTR